MPDSYILGIQSNGENLQKTVVFLRLHLLSLESYPGMIQYLVKADLDEVRQDKSC
jgi:hypothetical protein